MTNTTYTNSDRPGYRWVDTTGTTNTRVGISTKWRILGINIEVDDGEGDPVAAWATPAEARRIAIELLEAADRYEADEVEFS